MAHTRFDACIIVWTPMYHHSLGCQEALFIPCMYGEKSGGSSAFDLLPGTLLQPLSCAEIWITHPCLASLPTLVWTCPYADGHPDAHMHLENANIYCRLPPAYTEAWTETHTQSESDGGLWDCSRRAVGPALLTKPSLAFRPLSWCTLELCIHPICTPSSTLCSALQPSPQLLPGNSLTACLIGIYRNARQVPLTRFQPKNSYRKFWCIDTEIPIEWIWDALSEKLKESGIIWPFLLPPLLPLSSLRGTTTVNPSTSKH